MTLKPPANPNNPVVQGVGWYNAADDFGARGDGTTDATAALQNAISRSVTDGKALYIPSGTYKVTGSLTTTSSGPLKIFGDGPGLTILSHQVSGAHVFGALGSIGSTVAITAGSALGATQLTVTSTTGLTQGDFLVVRDTTQAILGNSTKTTAACAGEIARVRSVDSATQITLYGRLEFAYTTSGDIRKLTLVDGYEISGLSIINPNPGTMAAGSRGIVCTYVRGLNITNVEIKDLDDDGLRLTTCIDFNIADLRLRDLRDIETAGNPYGINVAGPCSQGLISRVSQRYGRHLYTCGSGSATEPAPAHITLDHCIATEMNLTAFDTHPGSRWHTFYNCEAHNCLAEGFQIRGPDTHVINPVVSQATKGVVFINGADRGLLRGGKLAGCDTGVSIDSSTDCAVKSVRVQSPVTYGVIVQESDAAWAGWVTDVEIDDVLVTGNPATAAFRYSVWNDNYVLNHLRAPSASTPVSSVSSNTPNLYGQYGEGFPGGLAAGLGTIGSFTVVANQAQLMRFVPQRNMTVTALSYAVTTAAGSNDNVDVGIYVVRTGTAFLDLLGSSGATAGKLNSNVRQSVTLSSPVKLVAGTVYYIALSCGAIGTTAAVIAAGGLNVSSTNQVMGTNVPNVVVCAKATSHPLPSAISGPSVAQTLAPVFGVLE